jgi:predicted nuclease of predicted toxin-antitoxin system
MKFLVDEDLPRLVTETLIAAGHDAVWVRRVSHGATDEEVVGVAERESRVIITRDKGFGEFVFRKARRVGVVLVRSRRRSREMADLIVDALAGRDDWSNLFAVIEDDRIRVGPLPIM